MIPTSATQATGWVRRRAGACGPVQAVRHTSGRPGLDATRRCRTRTNFAVPCPPLRGDDKPLKSLQAPLYYTGLRQAPTGRCGPIGQNRRAGA